MSKKKTESLIPIELIKEFENTLKQRGLIEEDQTLTELKIGNINNIKRGTKKASENVTMPTATNIRGVCVRWERVPTYIWDEQLRRRIRVMVERCVQWT